MISPPSQLIRAQQLLQAGMWLCSAGPNMVLINLLYTKRGILGFIRNMRDGTRLISPSSQWLMLTVGLTGVTAFPAHLHTCGQPPVTPWCSWLQVSGSRSKILFSGICKPLWKFRGSQRCGQWEPPDPISFGGIWMSYSCCNKSQQTLAGSL